LAFRHASQATFIAHVNLLVCEAILEESRTTICARFALSLLGLLGLPGLPGLPGFDTREADILKT